MAVIHGCATLSKSECKNADWETIGLEDGAAGRAVTYISRHRESCADYGVKPVLSEYQKGHSKGVTIFCRPRNGFELGSAGRGYDVQCPAALRAAFVAAYDDGVELYNARQALNAAQQDVKTAREELDEINKKIEQLEARLILGSGTAELRQKWINDLKALQDEQGDLQSDMSYLEHVIEERQRDYESLSSKYRY